MKEGMKKIPQRINLAVDLGASSGRVMAGIGEGESFELQEVHRFPNRPARRNGRLVWEHERLWTEIRRGLKLAHERYGTIDSVGVCSWGVDYVLLDEDGSIVGEPYAYRDESFVIRELPLDPYAETGIFPQSINTLYQLMARDPRELARARKLLFTADYFHYLLSGKCAIERSLASTSGLLSADTDDWAWPLIEGAGLPRAIFTPISSSGTILGDLRPDLQQELGFNCQVILPCGHDTACAYLAVPTRDDGPSAFLSSGTWSLIGCEREAALCNKEAEKLGFTNERGFRGDFRFLKNLSGMWLVQELRRELAPDLSWDELQLLSEREAGDFPSRVDVADEAFLAPASMAEALREACRASGQTVPETLAELLSVVYHSLADSYALGLRQMEELTDQKFLRLHIVGGGSRADYLNCLTQEATGLPVVPGPVEGSSLGNILAQRLALGEIVSVEEARAKLRDRLERGGL